jgi:hypothetical protein
MADFKKLKKKLDKVLEQAENEALGKGANIASVDFQKILRKLKEKLLEEHGLTVEEYEMAEMEFEAEKIREQQEQRTILERMPSGPKGEQGLQGERGETGSIGVIGLRGDKGETGSQGYIGPTGMKGDVGERGIGGPQGSQGQQGPQGKQGSRGDKPNVKEFEKGLALTRKEFRQFKEDLTRQQAFQEVGTSEGGAWGSITGTLSAQTDLKTALDAKATTELDNLGTVAINTSLISDTDDTDDLGSSSKQWKDLYADGVSYLDTIKGSNLKIVAETAASTDNSLISMCGGGDVGGTRGGRVSCYGNEHGSHPGKVFIQNGGVANTLISFTAGSSSKVMLMDNAGFYPNNDSDIDLGTSTKYWANAYIDKIYLNATAALDGATAGALLITGTLGVTGTRVTKGWFTDLEVTNDITIGGTALAAIYQAIFTFVDNETPSGDINSSNKVYALANTPSPAASVILFLNGAFQTAAGEDYTLVTDTITFVNAPLSGGILRAFYRY